MTPPPSRSPASGGRRPARPACRLAARGDQRLRAAVGVRIGGRGGLPSRRRAEGTPYLNTALMVGLYLNHAEDHLRAAARVAGDPRSSWELHPGPPGARFSGACDVAPRTVDHAGGAPAPGGEPAPQGPGRAGKHRRDRELGGHDALIVHHCAIVDALRARCAPHGPASRHPARGEGGRHPRPGPHRPAPTQRHPSSAILLDRDGSEPTGDLIFRVASAFVHGEHHILNLLSRRISDVQPAPAVADVEFEVRLDNFVVYMASVAIGIHRVALAAYAYAGWPDDVWETWPSQSFSGGRPRCTSRALRPFATSAANAQPRKGSSPRADDGRRPPDTVDGRWAPRALPEQRFDMELRVQIRSAPGVRYGGSVPGSLPYTEFARRVRDFHGRHCSASCAAASAALEQVWAERQPSLHPNVQPWSLAGVARTCLAVGTEQRSASVTDNAVASLCSAFIQVGDLRPAWHEDRARDHEDRVRTVRQPVLKDGEHRPKRGAVARPRRQHAGSPDHPGWVDLLGVDLEQYMRIGFAAFVAVVENGLCPPRVAAGRTRAQTVASVSAAEARNVLDQHFVAPLDRLRKSGGRRWPGGKSGPGTPSPRPRW